MLQLVSRVVVVWLASRSGFWLGRQLLVVQPLGKEQLSHAPLVWAHVERFVEFLATGLGFRDLTR